MNLDNLERELRAMVNRSPQVAEFEVSVSYGYQELVKIDFMLLPLEKNGIFTCRKTQNLFSFVRFGKPFEIGIFSPCGLCWQELSKFLDLYTLKIIRTCEEFAKAENERKDRFLSEFFSASFSPTLTFEKG